MTIQSIKVGDGTLVLGVDPDDIDFSAQMTNTRIEWNESTTSTAAIPVLSGEELPEEEEASYKATLAGNLIQDIEAAGVVAWSWAHRGEEVEFKFVPRTATARAVTGVVRVAPINLGGDVKQRNRSDISWSCIGFPELDDA